MCRAGSQLSLSPGLITMTFPNYVFYCDFLFEVDGFGHEKKQNSSSRPGLKWSIERDKEMQKQGEERENNQRYLSISFFNCDISLPILTPFSSMPYLDVVACCYVQTPFPYVTIMTFSSYVTQAYSISSRTLSWTPYPLWPILSLSLLKLFNKSLLETGKCLSSI